MDIAMTSIDRVAETTRHIHSLMNSDDYIEERVDHLKACAESIIKNARSIVGEEKFQQDLTVTIKLRHGEPPSINIDRDILPERFMEEL